MILHGLRQSFREEFSPRPARCSGPRASLSRRGTDIIIPRVLQPMPEFKRSPGHANDGLCISDLTKEPFPWLV
jgi:hypothetical protein